MEELESRCCHKKLSEPVRRAAVATVVLLLVLAVALSFTQLDVVLSLAGSTGGSIVAFILPGFLYFKACPDKRRTPLGIFTAFLFVFGIAFFVFGVVITLVNV